MEGFSLSEGRVEGSEVAEGISENEGDAEGKLVTDGTSEIDGSFEKVGVEEGAIEVSVGPIVAEGASDGTGVGFGEPVGLTEGG